MKIKVDSTYSLLFVLVPDTCLEHPGFYGELCNYQCHCLDGAQCDRLTGECPGYRCEDGWGGEDCQQGKALYVLILCY